MNARARFERSEAASTSPQRPKAASVQVGTCTEPPSGWPAAMPSARSPLDGQDVGRQLVGELLQSITSPVAVGSALPSQSHDSLDAEVGPGEQPLDRLLARPIEPDTEPTVRADVPRHSDELERYAGRCEDLLRAQRALYGAEQHHSEAL